MTFSTLCCFTLPTGLVFECGNDILIWFCLLQSHSPPSMTGAVFHGTASDSLYLKLLLGLWMHFITEKLVCDTKCMKFSPGFISWKYKLHPRSHMNESNVFTGRLILHTAQCSACSIMSITQTDEQIHYQTDFAGMWTSFSVLPLPPLQSSSHHSQESIEMQSWITLYTQAFVAKQHKGCVRGLVGFSHSCEGVCSCSELIGCQLAIISFSCGHTAGCDVTALWQGWIEVFGGPGAKMSSWVSHCLSVYLSVCAVAV